MEKIQLKIQKVDNGYIKTVNNKISIHTNEDELYWEISSKIIPKAIGRIINIELTIQVDDSEKKH